MTQLGQDILAATLGNAQTITLVPASLRPTLMVTHPDGTVETMELADVAIVPVLDMPAEIEDVTEIHNA